MPSSVLAPAALPHSPPTAVRSEPWRAPPSGPVPARGKEPRPLLLATLTAAACAIAYLIGAPPSADLAAATYRAYTFAHAPFAIWDNAWYGGHDLVAYSLLSPALSALVGTRVLLALSAVVAAALFATLAEALFPRRAAAVAAVWFAIGLGGELLAGRVPYVLGLTIALGSLLALQRRHLSAALALAFLASLASPLAGAFLTLAGLALAVSDRRGFALAASALTPIAALAVVFPEGGYEPFAAASFWPSLAGVVLIAVVAARGWRALRLAVVLYALALIAAYAIHTPVGGNVERLGALLAGPLLAGMLWERRRALLAVTAPLLLCWQLATPVSDLVKVSGDPSLAASYYAPLAGELERLSNGAPTRVEIPMTGAHRESSLVEAATRSGAYGVILARGWERQLDTRRAALFYRPHLSASGYHAWLEENAVSYVALPDVRLDASAVAEASLIEHGLPYLREAWRSAHWRLFTVLGARPLASPPALLTAVGVDSFTLHVPAAGAYDVQLHFTPYWELTSGHGCVREAAGGWTTVDAAAAGPVHVGNVFSLARVFDHGARCR